MNPSRRKLLTTGLASAAGLTAGVKLLDHNGLLPPDCGGIYGPGETLTYAAQRILTRNVNAREFSRDQISPKPFVNGRPFSSAAYKRHQSEAFSNWTVTIDGLVARPLTISLADIKAMPSRSQITHLACEEGWSYIAEWAGPTLASILARAEVLPKARYILYTSMQEGWDGSIDMDDALHPQTILAHSMNGTDLPHGHGGPLRIRVPRQLAYKSVKYINRITATDDPKVAHPGGDYAWFAGI